MAALTSLLLALGLSSPAWGLSAAAGKVDITPDLSRGRVYMAGFGATGRRPLGVHDPLYARLLLLKDGPRTVALVSWDLLGLARNDIEELRLLAGFTGPNRYLFSAATHVHSGPDTLGLWGPLPGVSGVDRSYLRSIKAKTAAALKELEGRMEEASLSGWSGTIDPKDLCKDIRDPIVIDPALSALSFKNRRGKSLATVVNWACHPEVLGRKNRRITADFPGQLCGEVEKATGGACLYFNGALGGLLTPETIPGEDPWSESRRIGETVATAALKGLARSRVKDVRPVLSFESHAVRVQVENSRYLLFLPALTSGHRLFDTDGTALPGWKSYWLALKRLTGLLAPAQRPWVETEVSVVGLGPALMLGMPAEVFPELFIGGYDGRFRGSHMLVKPENPDPPDLKKAPKAPYLKDLIRRPVPLFVGLANDELGYLVPGYDFKVRRNLTLSPRLPGDHYEETNSIGPAAAGILIDAAAELLRRDKALKPAARRESPRPARRRPRRRR